MNKEDFSLPINIGFFRFVLVLMFVLGVVVGAIIW